VLEGKAGEEQGDQKRRKRVTLVNIRGNQSFRWAQSAGGSKKGRGGDQRENQTWKVGVTLRKRGNS